MLGMQINRDVILYIFVPGKTQNLRKADHQRSFDQFINEEPSVSRSDHQKSFDQLINKEPSVGRSDQIANEINIFRKAPHKEWRTQIMSKPLPLPHNDIQNMTARTWNQRCDS
jgi:hypothetical protein